MEVFEAKNVEEAVELAVKFKSESRYNWFRGQSKGWPLLPSISRLVKKPGQLKEAEQRQITFLRWIKRTPGIKNLAMDIDTVLSIAQHHGIPTALLDFTTDPGVAGFFAAVDAKPSCHEKGCIYCLNTDDLRDFWSMMRKCSKAFQAAPDIAFITGKVPNLWRLEAQHGVFLYGPANWEEAYPLDRIVFPQTGHPSYPTHDDIYPKRKSQLELLLNQFFMADSLASWHEMVDREFPGATVVHLKPPPHRFEARFFVKGKLPILPDWSSGRLRKWRAIAKEPLRETALGEIGLRIDLRAEASVLRARVAFGVRRALKIDPKLRHKAVRWIILPQKRLQEKLAQSLDWLWNGMRTLPYSDEDIAEAAGLCFALHRLGFGEAEKKDAEHIATKLLGAVVQVEFGSWEGSFSRGYVSTNELRKTVRDDIEKRIIAKHRKDAVYVQPLLQLCSSPKRLFVFERFVSLFGRQIVPCQVLRPERDAAFFSPARLNGFGLP